MYIYVHCMHIERSNFSKDCDNYFFCVYRAAEVDNLEDGRQQHEQGRHREAPGKDGRQQHEQDGIEKLQVKMDDNSMNRTALRSSR